MKDQSPLPVPVSNVKMAFPADVSDLLPSWKSIPDEFKDRENEWVRFAGHWFARGLPATVEFYCKDGVDGETAFRHLKAVLGSYQPKHEHKIAGVAYLCSLWFEQVLHYKGPG